MPWCPPGHLSRQNEATAGSRAAWSAGMGGSACPPQEPEFPPRRSNLISNSVAPNNKNKTANFFSSPPLLLHLLSLSVWGLLMLPSTFPSSLAQAHCWITGQSSWAPVDTCGALLGQASSETVRMGVKWVPQAQLRHLSVRWGTTGSPVQR